VGIKQCVQPAFRDNLDASLFLAILLIYAELALVTALAILLSTVTSPILGAVILFWIYYFGHATGILVDIPGGIDSPGVVLSLRILYYIFPNLENFNVRALAANHQVVPMGLVLYGIAYGVMYSIAILFLSFLTFRKKDL